jgi:hypothetical protein
VPTDLQILGAIYDGYYDTFASFARGDDSRTTKILVPIDVEDIARRLKVDPSIVFGRLYYHLNPKHGYRQDDGSRVDFFTLRVGDDIHCVNFPLMASVLADLEYEGRIHNRATLIAVASLIVAIVSIVISILSRVALG